MAVVNGTNEPEVLEGTDGNDTLLGLGGGDQLLGLAGNDWLDAGEGQDFLVGGSGNDTLLGGGGDDALRPGSGSDTLDGGLGFDQVDFRDDQLDELGPGIQGIQLDMAAGTVIDPWGSADTLIDVEFAEGSRFDDTMFGDSEHDRLSGLEGNDFLDGRAGADLLWGGPGNDSLMGGFGGDRIYADAGDDSIDGGDGWDVYELSGSRFEDYLIEELGGVTTVTDIFPDDGDDGTDTLVSIEQLVLGNIGVTGEEIYGSADDDELEGTAGHDRLFGMEGNDLLDGLGGNDYLEGGAGDDTLRGGIGDDSFVAGSGSDTIEGGDGNDIYNFFGEQEDPVGPPLQGLFVDLQLGFAIDAWNFRDTLSGIEVANGSPLDDVLYGDEGENLVAGMAGDDELHGRGGSDNVNAGSGNDSLFGGEGDDFLGPGSGSDFIDGGPGFDLLTYAGDQLDEAGQVFQGIELDWELGTVIDGWGYLDTFVNVESIGASVLDDSIFGTSGDDYLSGVEGNDTLDGRGGNDVLIGGPGDDTLLGNTGDDHLVGDSGDDFADGGDGFDVFALSGFRLSDYRIEESDGTIVITDLNLEDGDDGTDTLVNVEQIGILVRGTDDNDVIEFEGDDPIVGVGEDGDDLYRLDNEFDFAAEAFNEGNDTVEAPISRSLEPNVENLVLIGDADVFGIGNELANSIQGNSGSNLLDGGEGADILQGGLGADTYIVDNEDDQVIETINGIFPTLSGGVIGRRDDRWLPDFENLAVGDDIDQVISTVTYSLTEFVENLTLEGSEDTDGSGNGLDNVLIGNGASNVLVGGSGNDLLQTGAGDLDQLAGEDGDDTYRVDKTQGYTIIRDNPGDTNTLELSEFLGSAGVSDLKVSQVSDDSVTTDNVSGGTGGTTLLLENTSGGVIEIRDFFIDTGTSIQVFDLGDAAVDVSGSTDAESVAGLLAASASKEPDSPLIDGEPYFQSRVLTSEGDTIDAVQAQTFRQYLGGLGREPANAGGLSFWLNKAGEGSREDMKLMARGFINTNEFQSKADANSDSILTDDEFVDHMYLNVFGRVPAEGGRNFWLNAIDRSEAAVAFMDMLQSPEFVLSNAATVSEWAFWDEIL